LQGGAGGDQVVSWKKIDRVIAYKRDCYTVDPICIAVFDREGLVPLEVNEGTTRYQELIDGLPRASMVVCRWVDGTGRWRFLRLRLI